MTNEIICVKPVKANCNRCTVNYCKLSLSRQQQPPVSSAGFAGSIADSSSVVAAYNNFDEWFAGFMRTCPQDNLTESLKNTIEGIALAGWRACGELAFEEYPGVDKPS